LNRDELLLEGFCVGNVSLQDTSGIRQEVPRRQRDSFVPQYIFRRWVPQTDGCDRNILVEVADLLRRVRAVLRKPALHQPWGMSRQRGQCIWFMSLNW